MRKSLWVSNKCQSLSSLRHLFYWDPQQVGRVTKGGEDDHTGYQARQEVYDGDNVGINMHLGSELVITSKHDDTSPGDSKREEDLKI